MTRLVVLLFPICLFAQGYEFSEELPSRLDTSKTYLIPLAKILKWDGTQWISWNTGESNGNFLAPKQALFDSSWYFGLRRAVSTTVTVASVESLLSALSNDSYDTIIVRNGRYIVSPSSQKRANSLWIGERYAKRTRPVYVVAQTVGGVVFDGNGATYFGGMSFEEGAHHQTWDGFTFTNGTPTSTGVIVFGGYVATPAQAVASHDIRLRNIKITRCTGNSTTGCTTPYDQGIYVSHSYGGSYNLDFENVFVEDSLSLGLGSAFAFHHSDTANGMRNARNVRINNVRVAGTSRAIILNDPTLQDIYISNVRVTNARCLSVYYAVASNYSIVLSNVISTGTPGGKGFWSPLGTTPSGIIFQDCDLR